MAVKKLSDQHIKTYLEMLIEHGEDGLYRKVIGTGFLRYASSIKCPEVEILDLSDAFFAAHRRNGDEILFTVGKVLRRSAHTLYRTLLRQDTKRPINKRFLNAIG